MNVPFKQMTYFAVASFSIIVVNDASTEEKILETKDLNNIKSLKLINMINKKNSTYNDFTISPKIRQTLQHWAYRLTQDDFI